MSKLIREVCRLVNTEKVNTTAYHPQTDGLVESSGKTQQHDSSKHGISRHEHVCVHCEQFFSAFLVGKWGELYHR